MKTANTSFRQTFSDSTGLILWLLLSLFANPFGRGLHAQNRQIKFDRISVEQGLSQSSINCILQDRQGFLWFGTQDGLNKYDGYGFAVYKHDPLDSSSLSDNYIRSIFEDRAGTLWIGTFSGGLNKFDRAQERFTRFVHDPKNPHSLSHNNVQTIFESHAGSTALAGTLWIGTEGGLNRLDRPDSSLKKTNGKSGQFTRFVNDPNDPHSLSDNDVFAICEDRSGSKALSGTLWIGTYNGGLNRFDPDSSGKSGQFTRFVNDPRNPHSLSDNRIRSLYADHLAGTLWIGTAGGGLNRFDSATEQFTHFVHDPNNPYSLSDNAVRSLYEDDAGTLWIGTMGGGLNRLVLSPASGSGEGSDRPDSPLKKINGQSGQFTHFVNDPKNPYSLSHDRVLAIHQDRSGTLWIGTNGGLNKFDRHQTQFAHFANDPNNANSLSNNNVWSICEDRAGSKALSGTFWIGTDGGLNRFDLPDASSKKFNERSGQFTRFVHDPKNPHSLSHDRVWSIYEDHLGTLWIGTYGGGLNRLDRDRGQFTRFVHDPTDPHSISHNNVWSIYEFRQALPSPQGMGRDGTLWIGTGGGGLNKLVLSPADGGVNSSEGSDRSQEQFTRFVHDPNNPHSLSDNYVRTIYEDNAGTLWIGTYSGGLNRFDRAAEQFVRFVHDPENPHSLSHNAIRAIYEDRSGTLWIGTAGGGLNKLVLSPASSGGEGSDRATPTGVAGRFTHYTEKDGLPNNVVYGILEDDHGHLWLSTNKGLSRFDPQTETFKNYDAADGLQSHEFNGGAYCKSRRGEMFFGGINGFNVFHPDSIKNNPYVPPVVITTFKRYDIDDDKGLAIEEKGINERQKIELSYKDDILSFEFAALSYRNSFKNQYAYKLEGFNENWIQLGVKRDVTFTNLDPGEYTLRVKGSNNDGVWNEAGTSLQITITPPWWKTWWAYSLYVLVFAGAIFGYIRYKTQAQAKELARERQVNERLRQVDKLKDEFLANTSHELRTPLNGIIGITESLLDGVAGKLPETAEANLSLVVASGKRLANLVNDILDFSKLKRRDLALQKTPIDIRVLTDLVLKFSEPLLAGKKMALKNEIPKDIPPVEGDENRLQQILHNLVDNAIKFTESGAVTVSAAQNDGMVEVAVSDTGIGIPQDKFASIFQSFEQVEASDSRKYGGAGLGLAITRQLVELHGGKIRVESQAGKGSTFTFSLPVSAGKSKSQQYVSELSKVRQVEQVASEQIASRQVASMQVASGQVASGQVASNGEFRILVVDDEPVNQQVLANHLSQVNYAFTQAFNGEEALRCLNAGEKFDLVLLDIMMPKMSGYEVCQRLRQKYLPTELPVIMVTAKDQVPDLLEGLACGANDYLAKPFSKDELLARIKTHLNLLKINTAYGRFVPHEFLRFLGKESIVDVKLGDHVQMEMTIFVSDIRAFTTLSEKMTPEENFAFINAYLEKAGPVIRNYHGIVDRYSTDAIMALFPRQADDAVKAAIATLKLLAEHNEERRVKGELAIQIGIGLHTGSLMLGIVGERERAQGDIFSDAVDLAIRIERLSKLYGASVVISEQALSRLPEASQYHRRFLGNAQVKGSKEPVPVFEIYDGDPADMIARKMKTQADFEEGLQHYFAKEFTQASVCFTKVLKANAEDRAARLYLERSAQFMVRGVPEDWEGVEAGESK
jgi:signal transduction histidine kinase/ligand-binding sensor domain-containing protein/CheY-like chemotaxis protein